MSKIISMCTIVKYVLRLKENQGIATSIDKV